LLLLANFSAEPQSVTSGGETIVLEPYGYAWLAP